MGSQPKGKAYMSEQGSNKWLWGCAIGCLASLLVLLLVVGGGAFFTYKGFEKARPEIGKQMQKQIEELINKGKIPDAQRPLIDELAQYCSNPDSSFLFVAQVGGIVQAALQDGTLSPQEIEALEAVQTFLHEHPNASLADMKAFQQAIGEKTRNIQWKFETPAESSASSGETRAAETSPAPASSASAETSVQSESSVAPESSVSGAGA